MSVKIAKYELTAPSAYRCSIVRVRDGVKVGTMITHVRPGTYRDGHYSYAMVCDHCGQAVSGGSIWTNDVAEALSMFATDYASATSYCRSNQCISGAS